MTIMKIFSNSILHYMKQIVLSIVTLLLSMSAIAQNAQSVSAGKLFFTSEITASNFNKGYDVISLDEGFGYRFTEHFGAYIPVSLAEVLYSSSIGCPVDKHYDIQALAGLGIVYELGINDGGMLLSLDGESTIGNYDFKYWLGRAMCHYILPSRSNNRVMLGVGAQYSSSFHKDFSSCRPCVSLGVIF